jgi:hypothetical protein
MTRVAFVAAVWSLVPERQPLFFDSSSSHSGTGAVVAEDDCGIVSAMLVERYCIDGHDLEISLGELGWRMRVWRE